MITPLQTERTKHLLENCQDLINQLEREKMDYQSKERSCALTKLQEAKHWFQAELEVAALQPK